MNSIELKNAFEAYFSAISKLKKLGVRSNSKGLTSQIGEWFIETIYNGKRADSGIQKYWDVKAGEELIQVKTHAKASTTSARWSAIKYDVDAPTTTVVIIVFTEDYKLKEFYKVPWKDCLNLIRRNKDRDVLMWDHLVEKYSQSLEELNNQEIISIFK